MIVYGRSHRKYVLNSMPVSTSYDGSTYSVEGNPDLFVKVYGTGRRSDELENKILSAVNRRADFEGLVPIDAAYIQGAFVGFVYERAGERIDRQPIPGPVPKKPERKPVSFAGSAAIICISVGLVFSVLILFVLFDRLKVTMNPTVAAYNMKGIPMIILGWILMLATFFRIRAEGNEVVALIFGIIAYIIGAVAAFGLIWLIVTLIQISASMIRTLLPVIIVILVLVALIGGLFKRRG